MPDFEPHRESPQQRFRKIYQGGAPWVISRPQRAVVELFETGRISGRVLDCGCGTGDNAIYLAAQGLAVTAFDFLAEPLEIAQQRAEDAGVAVDFRQLDALELMNEPVTYDSILDSGLYHVFPPPAREKYLAGLQAICRPGGSLFVLCFSDAEPGSHGPLRISRQELEADFSNGWHTQQISAARLEFAPATDEAQAFSAGGANCWLAHFCRASQQ